MKTNEIDTTRQDDVEQIIVLRARFDEDNSDHGPHYYEREEYSSTDGAGMIEYGQYDTVYIWTTDEVIKRSGQRYESCRVPRDPSDLDQ